MRIKKFTSIIFMTVLMIVLAGTINISNAATGSKYLGIKVLRESGYG